jgi:hypothetical protein
MVYLVVKLSNFRSYVILLTKNCNSGSYFSIDEPCHY